MKRPDAEGNVTQFPKSRGLAHSQREALREQLGMLMGTDPAADWHDLGDDPDKRAELDEDEFRRRFGFDACMADRRAVITIKHEADLTDREIRRLKRTGNLQIRDGQASLSYSRIEQLWGTVLIGCVCVLMLIGILAALRVEATWQGLLVAVTYQAIMVCLWWGGNPPAFSGRQKWD
ncbi:MAG: hypothetical protein Q4F49_05740 [Pseudoxanthomonas suwonensis]|nr:hypothetical protein [Pseudoxanthomonas suwonensis]